MKKFAVFAATAALCFFLCSCSGAPDIYERVSQIRSACFIGESDTFKVTAYSETKEYPLKADGFAGEMHDFVILKVKFKNTENMLITGLSVDFSLDKDYSASLPFKAETDAYVATVAVDKLPGETFTATITYGEKSENVSLQPSKKGSMSPTKALTVAAQYKKALIDKLTSENTDFEIMIRFMTESDTPFWYVGIVESQYTTALLISDDGKVLAEKRLKNQ